MSTTEPDPLDPAHLAAADEAAPAPAGTEPVRTGVPEVDAVLEEVERLEDRPVSEHPPVFESAHDQLRRSLDGRG